MGRKKIPSYSIDHSVSLSDGIKKSLKLLELDRAAQVLDKIKDGPEKEKSLLFLEKLLGEELSKREDTRIERWIKQAKFPWQKTLEEYDFTYPKDINKEEILALGDSDWVNHGGNVVFLGPPGVGKTHLSIALGLKNIERGNETRFTSAERIIESIRVAIEKDDELKNGDAKKKLFTSLINIKLLILDEFAYSNVDPRVGEFLFQIVFRRHAENRSIIFTANEHFSKWSSTLFGNEGNKNAAIDRLLHHGKVISIKGQSYRQKHFHTNPTITS